MAINSKVSTLSTQASGGEEIVRITVRKGNEADFLPSEMLPGELAISTDKGIARYCYAPGMIKIFATREDIYEIIDSSPEDYEKFKELVEYFKQNENVYNEIIANIGTLKNDVSYLKQNVSELGERCDKIEESIGSGGPSGTTVSVNVGDTVTGEPGTQAAVVNTGNNTNVILEFTIPRGEDGKPGSDGITPNLKMGQVSTLGPDEQATASITGDAENPVLNLGIPQGKPGSGSGGVSNNYEDLDNKPRIAGVEVSGNKSLEDYGIQPKGNYLQSIPEEYVTETELNSKGFLTSEDIPDSLPTNESSFYANKTIVMFGDSIVAGWGWEEGTGITQPLKENYPDATWINKAESGANMAEKSGAGHPSILSVIKGYSGKADYILVNGGTNDGNNGITIGSLGSSYEGPFTETTYIGALESAFKTLNDKFPMSHKCFLIPHKFVYDDNYLKEITDAAIKTCEKWSVPLVRMDQNSQIVMTEANKTKYTRNPNTGKGDGVHPNEEWYRSLYSPYVDGFLRKLGGVLGKESTPPSDSHTVLDYINVDGRCYFDTGVVPNLQTNFEIKCNPTNFEISGSYVCGIHDGTYKYGLSGTDNWYVVRGTVSSAAKPYVHYSQDWIIKQNGTNVLFNDDPVTLDSASDLSPSGTFFVCNMNNGSGSAKGENGLNGKLYYLKLYTGEELTCDLIPVKKSDGTICLYDNISKKYIYNIGTGTVSA